MVSASVCWPSTNASASTGGVESGGKLQMANTRNRMVSICHFQMSNVMSGQKIKSQGNGKQILVKPSLMQTSQNFRHSRYANK